MLEFSFDADVVLWSGDKAAWHFAVLPEDIADLLDDTFRDVKGGWGSLKVTARIGATEWQTSIFPDKTRDTFILPLKKAVRAAEDIAEGDVVAVTLEV